MSPQRLTNDVVLVLQWLRNKRHNPPLRVDDHRHLPIQLAVTQAMFDLFRLYAKAANLHLVIAPTTDLYAAVSPFADIAWAIDSQFLAIG